MEKMILEHVNIQDIPDKWVKFIKDIVPSTYRITIESESDLDNTKKVGNNKSWSDMPMFGMWKDRGDMNNPTDYVDQIRKSRF